MRWFHNFKDLFPFHKLYQTLKWADTERAGKRKKKKHRKKRVNWYKCCVCGISSTVDKTVWWICVNTQKSICIYLCLCLCHYFFLADHIPNSTQNLSRFTNLVVDCSFNHMFSIISHFIMFRVCIIVSPTTI